jgi:hypothetical protein
VVADVVWLIAVLFSWRALTREHWRTEVVPAEPRLWQRLGTVMPERALLALYRGLFFFGLCRMVAWTLWARALADPDVGPLDLSVEGPWWIEARSLRPVPTWLVLPVAAAVLVAVYASAVALWEPMGRAEARHRARRAPRARRRSSPSGHGP